MYLRLIFMVSVLTCLFTPVSIFAQIEKTHFSVKRNYGFAVGKSEESHWGKTKTGYGAGLNLNFFLQKRFAIGFDASFIKFSSKSNADHLKVSKELFTYTGTLNYYFNYLRLKPYLSAGGGFSYETFVYRIVDADNHYDQLGHINVPMFLIGTGCNIRFSDNAYFIFETKYVGIFSKGSQFRIDNETQKIHFNTNYISFFAGMNYEIKY